MNQEHLELFKSLRDYQLLAICILREAGLEPIEGKIAVGCVVRNRTKNNKVWDGTTYHEVILKPRQFSCFNDDDRNFPESVNLAQSIASSAEPWVKEAKWISLGVISEMIRDNTDGATHYHAYYVRPSWIKSMEFKKQIFNHLFYRES